MRCATPIGWHRTRRKTKKIHETFLCKENIVVVWKNFLKLNIKNMHECTLVRRTGRYATIPTASGSYGRDHHEVARLSTHLISKIKNLKKLH